MNSDRKTDKNIKFSLPAHPENTENKIKNRDIRHTGIDIIGDADWGTHFCQFYSTKQDLIDILVPYFKQGLADNEFCMWITSEPLGVTEAISALETAEPRLSEFINGGRIEILDYTEWYMRTDKFDSEGVLRGWVSKLESAQKRGYSGLRLTGNTFWLEKKDWTDFTAYEEAINQVIGNYNMLAMCTYNLEKCSALEIMDVMSNHQFALVKREGRWQIIENSERTLAEKAIAESEQRYSTIFEKSPFALTLTKMPEGTLTDVNEAFLNLFEFTREEAIGKTSVDLNISDQSSQEKISAILNEYGFVRDYETVRHTRTEKKVMLSLDLDWILIYGKKFLLTTIRDLTYKKRVEDELERTNTKLSEVLNSIQDDFYVLDRNWNFVFASRQFTSRVGKEPQNFVGKNIWEMFPKHVGTILEENYRATMEKRVIRNFEVYGKYSNDWYSMTSFPSSEGIIVLGTEITKRKLAEEELRRANDLLNAVTAGTGLIISTIDKEFRYTYFNKIHQKEVKLLTGKDVKIGMSLMEILSDMPDQLKVALDLWNRALKGETVTQTTEFGDETRYRRYYQTRHTPIYNENGEIVGAGEVTSDITENMQTIEKLRQSREDMARAQEVARSGSWRLDIKSNILIWSDENYRIFGIPLGTAMTYETFLETVHPDDREFVDTEWKAGIAGKSYDIEHRIISNGFVKWVREKAYLEFDEAGNLLSGFGITQDITDRKYMQENLQKRTDILEGINYIFQKALSSDTEEGLGKACLKIVLKVTGSNFGFIAEIGSEGLLYDIAISDMGWDMCLMKDKTGHRRLPGEFKIYGLYDKILSESKGFYTNDAAASHPDSIGLPEGHPGINSFIGVPLIRDSKTVGVVVAANNKNGYTPADLEALEALSPVVTEAFRQIRAEKNLKLLNETLEQRVMQRTQLAESKAKQLQSLAVELIEVEEHERRRLAELLHDDLQQIMAAAKMQLEVVCKKLPAEPALGYVKQLIGESIEKSRQLSRELSPAVLHHSGFIPALKWLAKQMDEQFGLVIDIEAKETQRFENIPIKMFIFRAVQELLFNVVKHADTKNASIVLSIPGDNYVITVSDQGKGFNPNKLNYIDKNTGFGLSSLLDRAHYIGCHFTINSSPGHGSSFTLTIPLSLVKQVERRKSAIRLQPINTTESTELINSGVIRVMFVDDHAVMRQGLISLISDQPDISVIGEASNGYEAIEKAKQLRPDIIVMDVSMPKMDGIEAAKIIKEEQPGIRIIGLSIHDDEQLVKKMRQAGAETLINKTASSAELLKAIYGMIQK